MDKRRDRDSATQRGHRIVVIAPRVAATFIRQDAMLLGSVFETELFLYQGPELLRRLSKSIAHADAVVIWFAGRHAGPAVFLARRYRKPVIQIVGGYEAAWIPEIGYGINPRSLRASLLRWVLRRSHRILAVSRVTEAGIRRVAPEVAGKIRLVYNGVDTSRFSFNENAPRAGVLSVGIIAASTLDIKGWRLFRDTAANMPGIPFTAVGPAVDRTGQEFVAHCPPNLHWLGELTGADLLRQFQSASVYFQGSRHESFSMALAESMACGCVPVASRYGALPEVAGELGFYLDELTPASATRAIGAALQAPASHRIHSRQRMIENFDAEIRRQSLCAQVEEVLS